MLSLRTLSVLLLVSAFTACGGRSFNEDDPETGGSDSGGTAAGGTGGSAGEGAGGTAIGGTGAGGTAIGGTGAGGTAIGGTGAGGSAGAAGQPNECTLFDDEAGSSIQVWISNETTTALHVGPTTPVCDTVPLFSVADAAGSSLPSLGWCRSSCQNLHEQGVGGCPAVCPIWETVTLEPGETIHTTWDGQYRVDGSLPSACVAGERPGTELQCVQAKTIRPGAYTFFAEAGTSLDCVRSSMCSGCEADPRGGCTSPGALVSGTRRQAVAKVVLDGSFGLRELWPRPGGDGALPAPPPPPPIVRLVFTE